MSAESYLRDLERILGLADSDLSQSNTSLCKRIQTPCGRLLRCAVQFARNFCSEHETLFCRTV